MTTLAVLLTALALPAGAHADLGRLTYAGCQADAAATGCADLMQAPLQGPHGLALSRDGRSLYSVGGSVAHLFRDTAGGDLSLDGCLNDDGSQNCVDLPAKPIGSATDVAVSPDGRSVYVVSYFENSIMHFFRAPGGQLFYDGCLADDAEQGCGDLPGTPLFGPSGVVVSPDGKWVYVTGSSTVASFIANGPEGQIAYTGCLSSDAMIGCVDLPGNPIRNTTDLAMSPDGRSLYVTVFDGDGVGYLLRNTATGKVSWDGCVNDDGAEGCVNVPGEPLDGAASVAVSPDGRSVYVGAGVGDSISHLRRNATTGALTWDGCVNGDGADNCVDVPNAPLDQVTDIVVSPDGRSVYATAYGTDAIVHLLRGAGGRLTWEGCLNDDGSEGCVDLPGAPLDGTDAVAVSPDGRTVYAGAPIASAITRFTRAPATSRPTPPPPKDTLAPQLSRVRVSHRGARVTVRYRLSEPATVTVTIRRRKITRAAGAGANRVRVRLRRGRYRVRLTAVDAAGNRSAPRLVRVRVSRRAGRPKRANSSASGKPVMAATRSPRSVSTIRP
jgi:6-phosphogluconolactonase (cycloisomerase 2 family)